MRQAGFAEVVDDRLVAARRGGEVEQAVARRPSLAIDLVQTLAELPERLDVVVLAPEVADALLEAVPEPPVDRPGPRVLRDRVVEPAFEAVRSEVGSGEADDREAARQELVAGKVVERGHELAAGKVAGGAEDDDDARLGSSAEA